jgi:RNA polymerase sigma factor (sigma-70 family)
VGLPPFETVVSSHGATVLRVLRGAVGPGDAEDCWQETFLSALRAYPQLRPDSDIRAWLLTIAHRKAIDLFRARGRGPVPVADVPESPGSSSGSLDPEQAVLGALAGGELWRQVATLPGKQRLAVAYRYGADLGYDEIGRLLDCSADAARRSAFEGVRRLRRTLPPPTTEAVPATDPRPEEGARR